MAGISDNAAFRKWRIAKYPKALIPANEAKHRAAWENSREYASFQDAKQVKNTRQAEVDTYADTGIRRGRK